MNIDKTFEISFKNDEFGYLDAFGLKDKHVFNPFKNLELPDFPPDITLVCGESGSGKTQLCKILAERWGFILPIVPDDTVSCCDFMGNEKENVDKCIYYLNYMGLSDARLYYTQFKYLSDSQKFRATIANTLMKNSGKGIFIDEFLSTLDRDTAKSISYLIQKIARKKHVKLLLATAHNDLIDYINPNLHVEGFAFPERFVVHDRVLKDVGIKYTINECSKEDYAKNRLGELHYKGKYSGGAKEFFVARLDNQREIGFLVSTIVGKHEDKKRRIARVVVHPSYRGIGVGTELVKQYLKFCEKNGIKFVSTVSALGLFNPFFEKAGMTRCSNYEVKPKTDFINKLKNTTFDMDKWFSKDYCVSSCQSVNIRKIVATKAEGSIRVLNPGGKKMTIPEAKKMILSESLHAGRYLWTLRPRTLAKFITKF